MKKRKKVYSMKKQMSVALLLLLMFTVTFPASFAAENNQSNQVTLLIDGQEVQLSGFIIEGKPYVSLEELSKYVGYTVEPSKKSDGELPDESMISLVSNENFTPPVTKVKLDYTTEITENYSVGEDWSYQIELNDNTYYPQHNGVELELDGNDLEFTLYAEEYDTTLPDSGTITFVVPYADIIQGDPLIFVKELTVKEDYGSNKGNIAKIEFTLILKPM